MGEYLKLTNKKAEPFTDISLINTNWKNDAIFDIEKNHVFPFEEPMMFNPTEEE